MARYVTCWVLRIGKGEKLYRKFSIVEDQVGLEVLSLVVLVVSVPVVGLLCHSLFYLVSHRWGEQNFLVAGP